MSENNFEDSEFQNGIRAFIKAHVSHLEHIPKLTNACHVITEIIQPINIFKSKTHKRAIEQAVVHTLRNGISEINNTLISALNRYEFSSVEALSRVAIEHTVNLFFITQNSDGKTASSFLYGYLQSGIKSAEYWLEYAKEEDKPLDIAIAEQKIASLKSDKARYRWLHDPETERWPTSTFKRFKAVGAEELYKTLYSTTSDSVHSLSEDCFNLARNMLSTPLMSPTSTELSEALRKVEKSSFAIFCAAQSLHLFCQAAINLLILEDEDTPTESLESVLADINALLEIHDQALLESRGIS